MLRSSLLCAAVLACAYPTIASTTTIVADAAPTTGHRPPGIIAIGIETSLGIIEAELDSAKAPISVGNFLRYVDARAYDNGRFHRTVRMDNQPDSPVKIEVIQGGAAADSSRPRWPAIELERTNVTGLRHTDGALSMARGGPNSATSDFFICIGAQPELDFGGKRNPDGQGFAAFGRVTKGMDVVRTIQSQKAEAQRLTPAVAITRIFRRR
ncbi:MAG: peptidylprolyl isomerase [bacterium]